MRSSLFKPSWTPSRARLCVKFTRRFRGFGRWHRPYWNWCWQLWYLRLPDPRQHNHVTLFHRDNLGLVVFSVRLCACFRVTTYFYTLFFETVIQWMITSQHRTFRLTGSLWGNPPVITGFPCNGPVVQKRFYFWKNKQHNQIHPYTITNKWCIVQGLPEKPEAYREGSLQYGFRGTYGRRELDANSKYFFFFILSIRFHFLKLWFTTHTMFTNIFNILGNEESSKVLLQMSFQIIFEFQVGICSAI